jgi:phosphatidate phosphatase APP1
VANDEAQRRSGSIVIFGQQTANRRARPQNAEERSADSCSIDLLRLTVAQQWKIEIDGRGQRDVFEDLRLFAPVFHVAERDLDVLLAALRIRLPKRHDAVGVAESLRSDQQRVDDAENRRGGADAQREPSSRGNGECRGPKEVPDAVSKLAWQACNHDQVRRAMSPNVTRFADRLGIAIEAVERRIDRTWVRTKRRFGWLDRPLIAAYDSYGNEKTLFLKGRVLEDKAIRSPADRGSLVDNFRMMYRRAASSEIPDAIVEADFEGSAKRAETDEEGYFGFTFEPSQPAPENSLWVRVELKLIAPVHASGPVTATGRVMVPPRTAHFGIISDLDDTVVHTDVTHLVKMVRTLALSNARTRLPFAGVAAFYRALHGGVTGTELNPIFYLSSSPWNLYDLFHDFLDFQGIPTGPLLLRDWGVSAKEFLPLSHLDHKLEAIRGILEFYPALPFILIGDSGQQDPEIYLSIVKEYPSRILAVYIRNVRPDLTARTTAIQKLFTEAVVQGISLKLVSTTVEAARDAADHGWINPASLPEIGGEARKDVTPGDKIVDRPSDG